MSIFLTVVVLLALVWALLYVGTLIHEMGHVAGALLAGLRPYLIIVGSGKARRVGRIGGLRVRWGSRPGGGFAYVVGFKPTYFRLRFIVCLIGGPAATFLLMVSLAAVCQFLDATNGPGWILDLVGVAICIELYLLGLSVIPRKGNDAGLLWRVLRMKTDDQINFFRGQIAGYAKFLLSEGQLQEARELLEDIHLGKEPRTGPAAIRYWIGVLLGSGRPQDALKEAERVIADTSKTPRVEILDAIACIPLIADHPEFLPFAKRCIDEAIQLEPNEITLKGTKGALLIEDGQIELGIQALEEVQRQSESDNDQAYSSYYLAYALFKKGDKSRGEEQWRLAMEKHPTCEVAAKIKKKFSAISPAPTTVSPAT